MLPRLTSQPSTQAPKYEPFHILLRRIVGRGRCRVELVALFIFGLALSLDGFGAGLAYGIRQIKVPLTSLIIISLTSGAAITASLALGHTAASLISPSLAQTAGGFLLVLLGLWILSQALRSATRRILRLRIPQLGLVIQVLLEPLEADLDDSGCISPREAALLGISLALDAFGAGFAIALSGMPTAPVPVFVVIGLFLMLNAGMIVGSRFTPSLIQHLNVLPGCILIIIGMFRLLHLAF